MTDNEQQPFSEEAALRALDDLQRAIAQSRLRRKEAADAFDRFLRSFDRRDPLPPIARPVAPPEPAAPPSVAPPIVTAAPPVVGKPPEAGSPSEADDTLLADAPSALQGPPLTWPPADLPPHPEDEVDAEAPTVLGSRSVDTPETLRVDGWEPHGEPSAATAAFHSESDLEAMTEAAPAPSAVRAETHTVPAALRAPAPRTSPRLSPAIVLLALVVAGGAVFSVWRAKSRDAQAAAEPTAAIVSAPAPVAAAPLAVAAAAPAAELSTVRKVWVRVLVDGQKVLEQELPPDARIPLTPTSQVIVRAGDAGAVRVAIAGKDQGAVGRDGEVATKLFKVATPLGR